MSRINSVPIIVQQIGESIEDTRTPINVQFNQVIVLENIRDYCESVIARWNKQQNKKR